MKTACAIITFSMGLFTVRAQAAMNVISAETHRLGVAGRPEWQIFEGKTPEGERLRLDFQASPNEREHTLFIRQDDVKQEWTVTLNGKKLGNLFLMEADLIHTLAIPTGSLREGANQLEITSKASEDILIRGIAIGDDAKENLLSTGPVTIAVNEAGTGEALPCRITLTDRNGSLAAIYDFGNTNLASRPGVIYAAHGRARIRLLPGNYNAYATRGPEYEVAQILDWDPQATNSIVLTLSRKADTRGWVACDTHIHTLSLSKHGDALLRERIITLAGEGIELAVSTEHNLHADYRPETEALGLQKYFTILPGNEVTTKKGHFNIFPVDLTAKPPDASLESWPDLFRQIRATPHVQVAILNHPTDTHSGFTPFAITNLNILTGKNLRGDFNFEFDAMELINSGAMRSGWMEPFRAWFALLNRGYKITGVGSSDSHDVSRFIVGQGRTYINVDDSDVSHINLEKACESIKQGRAVVSLGLIAQLKISDAGSPSKPAGPGDLLSAGGGELDLNITVDAPLAPGQSPLLTLCANGAPIYEGFAEAQGFRTTFTKRIPKPRHDTYYVLIAEIYTDTAPAWGLARPYQPTSRRFRPTLIGATNPIWVDADGNGKFDSARDYARSLVSRFSNSPKSLSAELSRYDLATGWQTAELLIESGENLRSAKFDVLRQMPAIQHYLETLDLH